jgi:S-adenosyl-L-methionine hydrolase (adenosine-forming)
VARPIVFLSDYGVRDEFAGVCRGVIAGIAPEARVIDLTHGIERHDIDEAALMLARSAAFMPDDAVYLAVVDPGVGSERRPVAVEAASRALLVGPDNGLLAPACRALGGATRAVQLASPRYLLWPISNTFHGRDLFAPAAAHLARGVALEELGPPLDPSTLQEVGGSRAEVKGDSILCSVLSVDGFGNVQLNVGERELAEAGLSDVHELRVETSREHHMVPKVRTFSDLPAGHLAALVDSSGYLALVVNRGNAAAELFLARGDGLVLAPVG